MTNNEQVQAKNQKPNKSMETHTLKYRAIELGSETSFTKLPFAISLENRLYYLVRKVNGSYQLLSTICPHQGGEVVNVGPYFECPQHGWCFVHTTGKGINNTGKLSSLPVTTQGGRLFTRVPSPTVASAAISHTSKRLHQLTIQLHSHACIEIVYKGFSLLTDPWLCGPAFLGSWTLYPPPVVDVSTLRPHVIVITHEHPDHFHEPTLKRFDRSTPIYVPDFPNRRLVGRLVALGFLDVHPMAFGKTYDVSEVIKLTCFEPGSLWNDAIILVEIDGFRLLNLNDAGLNQRIASMVAPVDVIASQFSTGASGYPLTWDHLEEVEKVQIMQRNCQGKLRMLKEAMTLYGSEHLLPFASHFALWHPSHREYVRVMKTNTIDDVVKVFEGTNVHVVDLLPGEIWDVANGSIARLWQRRERLYDLASKLRYLEQSFDFNEFEKHHPTSGDLTQSELEAYFLRLNETPEIAFCEELTVRIRTVSGSDNIEGLDYSFRIAGGQLRTLKDPPMVHNLLIEIPSGVLRHIVKENLSWDEAHIGYWCRFARSTDIYNAGFWRLLQAPYFNKPAEPPPVDSRSITADTVVADIVESHGDRAERILRRYGLYCAGCYHSTSESLAQGARSHGVEETQINRLVRELNKVFPLTR